MIDFLLIFAYFLGSVPTGVVLTKAFGRVDPRTQGSGNIGATNIYRTSGKGLGIITLLGDIVKGVIPVMIAGAASLSPFWVGAVGLAAFVGHLFPVYLKFKGGKGIATALGVFLALAPLPALISFALFVVIVYQWRYISLGSLAATAAFPVLLAVFSPHPVYIPFAVVIGALIFYRHRGNIQRLLAGNESKFGAPKSV
ncbi:MAG TPA: glycerol-3-phosphate 1-O-acyltransferase PlsY [Thermodesulfobacteriota bacterium]|nr:glycerol-3-phosphate 1-O-acyltransferase PlsY [Thermodesulfobacteriota bacterium]